jgi:hypothetical protein
MPEEELLTFGQVLKEIADEPTSLLLGNGFSAAYNPVFNYEDLRDEVLKRAFKGMDVEEIMRRLFNQPNYIVNRIKAGFIKAVGDVHPMREDDTTIASCATFLKNFSRLYTLNYDVIIYWVINSDEELRNKFVDGFGFTKEKRRPNWPNSGKTSTFYLHGSLLLYCDNTERNACPLPPGECHIKKHTRPIPHSGLVATSTLTDRLRKLTKLGQYPHFVSEGDYKRKHSRIQKCTYLKGCYEALKSEVGNLVTYGVSFRNDQHILVAINDSKIKCCYLGIKCDDKSPTEYLIEVANYLRRNAHTVKMYKAETAKVWR